MAEITAAPVRRTVRYQSMAELLADAEQLAVSEHRTIGNWSLGQIFEHISKAITCSMDGFGFQAPWFSRVFIAPFVKNAMITKGMKPGFKLPKRAESLLPTPAVSTEVGLESLRQSIRRFDREPGRQPHPFLGPLASQEWISLMLRHAELHMGFVLPTSPA